MEAIQPSTAAAALNVHDLRRQECRGGEEGEYYLGLLAPSSTSWALSTYRERIPQKFDNVCGLKICFLVGSHSLSLSFIAFSILKCTSIFLKTFHGSFCMLKILANAFGTITITISTIIINFQRVLSVTTGWRYAARCKKQRWKHYGGNTARGTYFLSHLSNRLYDDVELIVCVWCWQHYGANTARGTYCFLSNLNF